MNRKHVRLPVAVCVCLTALLATRPKRRDCDLSGVWLTTFVFPGRRPIQAAITFDETSPASPEGMGQGRWTRTGGNQFSVAFRLPGGSEGGSDAEYRVTGALTFDSTVGRLWGPVSCDVLDAGGSVISTLRGAAKARRISLDNKHK
jgi:hypothetical protein